MTPIAEVLARSFLARLRSLEKSLYHLAQEISEHHPPGAIRQRRKVAHARLELAGHAIEEMIEFDPDAPEDRDSAIGRAQADADELALLHARIARMRRQHERRFEDLDHDRDRLDAEQIRREIDAELGDLGEREP